MTSFLAESEDHSIPCRFVMPWQEPERYMGSKPALVATDDRHGSVGAADAAVGNADINLVRAELLRVVLERSCPWQTRRHKSVFSCRCFRPRPGQGKRLRWVTLMFEG